MAKKLSKSKKPTKSKKAAKKTPRKTKSTSKTVTGNPWLVKQFQEEGDPNEHIRTKQKRVEDFYEWLIEKFYNNIPLPCITKRHFKVRPRWYQLPNGDWELQIDLTPPPAIHGPGAGSSDPPSPTQPPPKLS